ncbi:MAG: hypothetical protein EOO43_09920 [Flavobacterium sp.]|nr:MAG: hypothetical protein EOO43_09920 [Flavobacterium sp.]
MDLNSFGPFRAEVWGAVSDWLILLTTAAGTLYIARTFRQQQKINESQQRLNEDQMQLNNVQKELNRLALEKDKREVFAAFSFQAPKYKPGIKEKLSVKIVVKENKALDIEVFPIKNGEYQRPIWGTIYIATPESDPFEIILENYVEDDFDRQYLIYFTDQSGRPYTQDVGIQSSTPVILYPIPQTQEYRKTLPKNKWSS